jgi:NACHT domain-containing protein
VGSVQAPKPRQPRQRAAAGPWRLRLRWLRARLSWPFVRMNEVRRGRRKWRSVDGPQRWRRSRFLVSAVRVLSYAGAVLFVVWVVRALVVVVTGERGFLFDLDEACSDRSFSCDALAGTLAPVLSVALVSAVFLLVRLRRVRRPFQRRAQDEPQDLVLTAGRIIGDVVGRDELCQVLIEDLRDRKIRRPHVVVGGAGTGKTALLVRLTELLAQRGAVPVPVRLRDANSDLDFHALARDRFLSETQRRLLSEAEGEKVWRHLLKNDQIVVLADGLEEALVDGDKAQDRDNLIRLAIRRAKDSGLSLVVASRPHDPLREMEAAIVDLEPLSEEAALDYVRQTHSSQEEHRLDWIVETADVVETPLYLQITRQLHREGLTEFVSATRTGGQLDTRSVDRAELRARLLDTWMDALLEGRFHPGLALSLRERQATVEQLSALACLGLREDTLEVRFDRLEHWPNGKPGAAGPPATLMHPLLARLQKLDSGLDIRLAATRGAELGLVETRGDRVRFPHSIMQAYLGSRRIQDAIQDEDYRNAALAKPGRELLIAMVMHSRRTSREARPKVSPGVAVPGAPGASPERLQRVLAAAAKTRNDLKALDLYAAALEIDSVDASPEHAAIAAQLRDHWPRISVRDERSLEEAKLNLLRRFGEAARTIVERRSRNEPGFAAEAAYMELYRISAAEPWYPIRLAAAQEIGAGGDQAFVALQAVLGPDEPPSEPDPRANAAPAARDPAEKRRREECAWREQVTRAWLAPLLVGSVSGMREAAWDNLDAWLRFVRRVEDEDAPGLRLSLEVALAQGFKHAANRRGRHPHAQPEARSGLQEQAREMLRRTTFWFTRLTLIQALTLWSLPAADQPSERRRDVDHDALVDRWAALPDGRPEHPFVLEARKLAVWALETGQPERFIWIDESGVLRRVGSRPASQGSRRKHNLWIPPSTGWTALHPRAQQLVADVLLLLNLAERGAGPADRTRRLRSTDRSDLPPCLAGQRLPLDPMRTVGTTRSSEPGSHCKHGCLFELCPYPPKGEKSYRAELSEAFCRRQQALVSGGSVRRKAAPWQGALPGELKRFWGEMGLRAHRIEEDRERGLRRQGVRARARPKR